MPDLGTIAAPAAFLTTLGAMLTYLGNAILSDRKNHAEALDREQARTQRAEDALARCQDRCASETGARVTAEQKLALAELQIARLSIEYGHSENRGVTRG